MLIAFSLLSPFPYLLLLLALLLVLFCHETRLNPVVRAICSRTYLYFIIAEVFTLCPPPLLLLLSPTPRSFSYLLSCLLYDIYSDAERGRERLLLQCYEAEERGGRRVFVTAFARVTPVQFYRGCSFILFAATPRRNGGGEREGRCEKFMSRRY